jgi:hypothetical protein
VLCGWPDICERSPRLSAMSLSRGVCILSAPHAPYYDKQQGCCQDGELDACVTVSALSRAHRCEVKTVAHLCALSFRLIAQSVIKAFVDSVCVSLELPLPPLRCNLNGNIRPQCTRFRRGVGQVPGFHDPSLVYGLHWGYCKSGIELGLTSQELR